MILMLCPWESG